MRKQYFSSGMVRYGIGFLTIGLIAVGTVWPAHAGRATTLHVVEHALTDTAVDIGPHGDSLGDVLAFANPIFDAANQRQIGSDNGHCIRTVVGQAYECFWTIQLRGGQITVEGPFYDTRDSTLAITGGSGAYRAARGEMGLHARNPQGTEYDFVYQIGK